MNFYKPAYNLSKDANHPPSPAGFKLTSEHIASISGEKCPQAVSIYLYDLNKNWVKKFGTVTLAAQYPNCSTSFVSRKAKITGRIGQYFVSYKEL